jgi:acyl-CoA dehydrogenase
VAILYDEPTRQIAAETARILTDRYDGAALKALLEKKGAYDEAFWTTCREQGWTGVTLPERYGGLGLGLIELGVIAERCGAAACGAPYLASSYAVAQAILRFGDEAAKDAWLPLLASGEVKAALALSEDGAPLSFSPSLRFENGKLTGRKSAVSGGGAADLALALATGKNGPLLVIAPLRGPGASRRLLDTFDNSRVVADLDFEGAPATPLGGDAMAAARKVLQLLAVVVAFEQVGGAEKMFMTAREHALTRKAFGQPIAAFQSIKHRIVEDYVLVELARANAEFAAIHEGDPHFGRYAAAARLSATDAYDTVTRDATQIHGGIGVTWEADLHLHQRRARTLAIEAGNRLFWEDELVNALTGAA